MFCLEPVVTSDRYFLQERQSVSRVGRGRIWLKDADQTGE